VSLENTTFAPSLGVDLSASRATPGGAYIRDTVEGTGAELRDGQTVGMYYTGYLADGTRFDGRSSGEPFSFQLGAGRVIRGWDEGLQGMKVGGKRQIVIPAELGYGARGIGPIPPNSVLVFDVEARSAE
jgi:FKBP-type peptidyl-prolyl cis-trans isomerase